MTPVKNYQQHLSGAESLVTSYEEIRAGFVSLALERNQIPGLVRVEVSGGDEPKIRIVRVEEEGHILNLDLIHLSGTTRLLS